MKVLYVFGAVVLAILVWIYYRFDPGTYNLFPQCPFHLLTGLDCPGCGSQRALHALLKGDLSAAMDFNLLLVASLPLLTIHFFHRAYSLFSKKEFRWKLIDHPLTPIIVGVVITLFWIARNIPYQGFSYLAA